MNWNQTNVQEWEWNPKNCLSGNRTHELVKSVKMKFIQMFENGSRTHKHIESVFKKKKKFIPW